MKTTSSTLSVSNSGDMSQATLTSGILDVRSHSYTGVQAVYTGAPVGSLQMQAAFGQPDAPSTGSNNSAWGAATWTPIGTAVPITAASSYIFDLIGTAVSAVRFVYTKTSGTGTLTFNVNVKA